MKTTDGNLDRIRKTRPVDDPCDDFQRKNNPNARHRWVQFSPFWMATVLAISTGGCLGTDNSKLVGRWEGQSRRAAGESSDSQASDNFADSNADFTSTLDFRSDYRFSMKLVTADGQVRQTQGTWQIDQATGTRWEVTLRQDDNRASVRLRIAFDDKGFTARQVDGDDRVHSIHYRRVDE